MAEQYTNIKSILDKCMRHPLMRDLSLETVVDYTVDFMRIVGVPAIFEEKVEVLEVKDYRALLPCDYYKINQLRDCKSNMTFRYSSDSFHLSECKEFSSYPTYKIQGNVIFTTVKEGEVEISYQAIATDSDGYPLIPDNSSFTRALSAYIKQQWFTILFDLGKIRGDILQNAQQEYSWAVGDCQTEFNRLSLDKAESFFNSWKSLIIRDYHHSLGFKYNNAKEKIKIH